MNKSSGIIHESLRYNVARYGVAGKGMSVSEYISESYVMPEGATVTVPFMAVYFLNNGGGGNYQVWGKAGAGKKPLFPWNTGHELSGHPHRFSFIPTGREIK